MVLLQRFRGLPGEQSKPHFLCTFLDTPPGLIQSDWLLIKENQERKLRLQSSVHLCYGMFWLSLLYQIRPQVVFCDLQEQPLAQYPTQCTLHLFNVYIQDWFSSKSKSNKPIYWKLFSSWKCRLDHSYENSWDGIRMCPSLKSFYQFPLVCFSSLGIVGWC